MTAADPPADSTAHRPTAPTAGEAYLVHPEGGAGVGPGVLVLSSWWGLTPACKERCHQLADLGYVACAPDLMGGLRPETAAEAELELGRSDPNVTASLILSSLNALRSQTRDPRRPIGVVGWSMGASWALWLATRQDQAVSAVIAYYGTQDIDFVGLNASVLGHFGTADEIVEEDSVVEMQAHLRVLDKAVDVHWYDGCAHFFAETESAISYDSAAAELAWQRTSEHLAAALQP
jgi:carboxymethylenebutenolidase